MTEPEERPTDKSAAAASPNAFWGSRFGGGPAAIMRRINASIDFDKRLYAEDIAGSKAHCAMLVAQRILAPEDGAAITAGLEQIQAEIDAGSFVFRDELEDIHLNVEARLTELIGPAGGRLLLRARATTRSRPISNYGCAARSTGSTGRWRRYRRHCSIRPRRTRRR